MSKSIGLMLCSVVVIPVAADNVWDSYSFSPSENVFRVILGTVLLLVGLVVTFRGLKYMHLSVSLGIFTAFNLVTTLFSDRILASLIPLGLALLGLMPFTFPVGVFFHGCAFGLLLATLLFHILYYSLSNLSSISTDTAWLILIIFGLVSLIVSMVCGVFACRMNKVYLKLVTCTVGGFAVSWAALNFILVADHNIKGTRVLVFCIGGAALSVLGLLVQKSTDFKHPLQEAAHQVQSPSDEAQYSNV